MGSLYTTSGASDSGMPLIKVKKSLKHRRNELIQPVCYHCTFLLSL